MLIEVNDLRKKGEEHTKSYARYSIQLSILQKLVEEHQLGGMEVVLGLRQSFLLIDGTFDSCNVRECQVRTVENKGRMWESAV
jgi:hypothetical protein